jgi:hypothetical protein
MRQCALIVIGIAVVAATAARPASTTATCGVERWTVKTLQDRPRLLPRRITTVHYLVTRPAPGSLPDTRLPFERHVFTVTAGVVLVRMKVDRDLHLVLQNRGQTMIAEAPAAACDTRALPMRRRQMAVARSHVRICRRARVTGVAFFDFDHGQTGVARNAIELHPILAFRCLTSPTTAPVSGTLNTVSTVLSDMRGPSQGQPYGWPLLGPALGWNVPPAGATRLQGWGGVWADSSNTFPAGVRVELKNFETYVYSKSKGAWTRVEGTTQVGGALYHFSSTGNTQVPADWRVEPDGGVSATPKSNYALHFWPKGLAPVQINAADVGAVFTTVDARLIGGSARYLLDVGADWYPAAGSTLSAGQGFAASVGFSKYVYLSASWQPVSFYTGGPAATLATSKTGGGWTESQLQATPPPMDSLGKP